MKSTGTEFNEIAIELSRETDKRRLRSRLYWDVPCAVNPGHLIHLKRIVAQGQQASRETQLLKDQILRARADIDNARKRALRDREELVKRANEGLLVDLLGVMDHFELGIRSGKQHEGTTRQFVEGIEMSFKE
jgi:molecular chaperone GrpE (heat shock protein)